MDPISGGELLARALANEGVKCRVGVGIPAPIGAKLAEPSRDVVCVTADGAAGFNAMELRVAAREGVKVAVVVMAEGQWTMEIPNERARSGRTVGTAQVQDSRRIRCRFKI